MAKSKKQTEQTTGGALLENPDALADQLSKTEEFIEKNKGLVLGVLAGLILIVGGYFAFDAYKNSQNIEAQNEMFQAIYYFEADSLQLALNGDGINLGFKDIIAEYGFTDAANLATYYAGASFLKQGDAKSALLYLEDFGTNDLLVQARAYALVGDAHMQLEEYGAAATAYEKAADYKGNKFFSPRYLMKAALAHERADNLQAARGAYEVIITEYWDSSEVQNAKKLKARLEKAS